jgi:FkbM family methyltransferase
LIVPEASITSAEFWIGVVALIIVVIGAVAALLYVGRRWKNAHFSELNRSIAALGAEVATIRAQVEETQTQVAFTTAILGAAQADLSHAQVSFAQEGEDLVLARLFPKKDGWYVDIGAHDPYRFSNTALLSARGWRGINVDASEAAVARFQAARPRDINIHAGVGTASASLTFFEFNEPALSTFVEARAKELEALDRGYQVIRRVTVPVLSLREILERNLPSGQAIDFLTVDVEGLDLEVLRSGDWNRFRPRVLVVEELNVGSIEDLRDRPLVAFLHDRGYRLYSKLVNALFFIDERDADTV